MSSAAKAFSSKASCAIDSATNEFYCRYCGERKAISKPFDADVLHSEFSQFKQFHEDCADSFIRR